MIELWFDGIVEPENPGGHGGFGMLVKIDGKTVHEEAHYMGRWPSLSNNCTEYAGAIGALRYLLANNITEATIYGDADMIIKQLNGRWRAREGTYTPYFREAMALRRQLPNVTLKWIPREMNREADELSRVSVKREPRVITFQLDPTVDVSGVELTPRTARDRRRRNQRRQITDALFEEFMDVTEGI